jgi:hypothetical protein
MENAFRNYGMGSPYLRPPQVAAGARAQNPAAAAGAEAQNTVAAAAAGSPATAAPRGAAIQQDQGAMAQTHSPLAKRRAIVFCSHPLLP